MRCSRGIGAIVLGLFAMAGCGGAHTDESEPGVDGSMQQSGSDTGASGGFDATGNPPTQSDASNSGGSGPGEAGSETSTQSMPPDAAGSGVGVGDAGPGVDAQSTVGKIEHVVLIMQENRSFDHYFGMFPGVDGFTLDAAGNPTNCNPDPHLDGGCVVVFHDPADSNAGGPHSAAAYKTCFDTGKMDGFIKNAEGAKTNCADPNDPECTNGKLVDVMGYKTGADIPNYWAYASAFTLLDHQFESDASWSWPMHQYMVSEWAALCTSASPMSCTSNIGGSEPNPKGFYSWTPLTYILDAKKVTWRYYLAQGTAPDCDNDEAECPPVTQLANVPSIWNPLPLFEVVKNANEQTTNVVTIDHFYTDAKAGTLPAVSWIAPSGEVSEHPPNLVSEGQAYVTSIVNVIMQDPELWSNTAIFLFWDDWGGFYDHVQPTKVDVNGYGFRTPGIVLSAWAKPKNIDHQQLSFDAYAKFIEDTFLSSQRLDGTDGRPDSRPDVREALPTAGDLRLDFDFTQAPNKPLVLAPK
jgi:phospholipase C